MISDMTTICELKIDEYCEKAAAFHGGHLAPGMILAGFMVDLGVRQLPEGTLFEVICETTNCMPDAVQILTPCTVGNQWMKIIDVGRYAMSFYDKYTGKGVRVWLDTEKMKRYPTITEWNLKLKPKKEQDKDALMQELLEAGTDILSVASIQIDPKWLEKVKNTVGICSVCGESFKGPDKDICPACRDEVLPYDK